MDIQIKSLRYENNNKVVIGVNWKAYLIENNFPIGGGYYTAYSDEYTELPNGDPSSSDFIDYENLDEETVYYWIEQWHDMEELTKRLQAEIDEMKKDSEYSEGIPWKK